MDSSQGTTAGLSNRPIETGIPDGRIQNPTIVVATAVVFSLYSLIIVAFPGVNEPHYLTKARAFASPEWCSNDFFLRSSNAHAVFFFLVGPLTKVLSFSVVALSGRLVCLTLLAVGWTMLGRQLNLNGHSILRAAVILCLIATTGNFSGEWIIGGFESKVPAYGLALIGVAWWIEALERRTLPDYAKAGTMIGASVALHPVVGLWFAIGIVLSELAVFLRRLPHNSSVKQLLTSGVVFCGVCTLFSLPGLLPALKLAVLSDVPAAIQDRANRIQVFWRLDHHLDASSFPPSAWIHTAVLACILLAGSVVAGRTNQSSPGYRKLLALVIVAGLISAIGAVAGWHSQPFPDIENWELKARILRFYPFRFLDAMLPIACAFSLSMTTTWVLETRLNCNRKTPVRSSATEESASWTWIRSPWIPTALLISIMVIVAAINRRSTPSGYSAWTYWHWKDACRWIEKNTPPESLIFTPRESFAFKWIAQRAEYVCFKDCPQDGPGIVEWNERFKRIHRWAQSSYIDDSRFDDADLSRLNELTGMTHIITRKLGPFESSPIYENDVWRIYQVPDDG